MSPPTPDAEFEGGKRAQRRARPAPALATAYIVRGARILEETRQCIDNQARPADPRPNLDGDIAGAIFEVNERALRARLGTVSRAPRCAVALKYR